MESKFELTHTIDPQDYLNMRAAVGWSTFAIEQATEGLKNSTIWCFRDEGRPIALGRIVTDHGYIVYIADIIVLPEYQGQGLGRQIMETIMKHIKTQLKPGYRIMAVLVAAEGKDGFYEKFGFIKRPSEIFGPGMHQWLTLEPQQS